MPETSVHFAKEAWEVIKWIVGLFVGLFGFVLNRQVKKTEELERSRVHKDDFNNTLTSLRNSINKGFDDMREDVRGIHSRIDKIVDK